MQRDLNGELAARLAALKSEGLYRELREIESAQTARVTMEGRAALNFASNDYLGFANEPALKEAAARALEKFGAGSGASRLVCGSLSPHARLEESLAAFKRTEAALSFSSGYATALGTICALMGKEDVIAIDRLAHASIVDGARLSGARLRVFRHNDPGDLEDILKWADSRGSGAGRRPQILIATESVFSMDGDFAPLKELADLKEKYGAWLMLDEAHGTGLFGPNRRGVAAQEGVSDRIDIQMGTLGKALGAAGGYIAGSRTLIDYLTNKARSFIFSTAPCPAQAAAATAGIDLAQSAVGEERVGQVWRLWEQLQAEAGSLVWKLPAFKTAILPLMVGGEVAATELARRLRERGIFVPAIRYPTVKRGAARLRLTLTAAHRREDVAALTDALKAAGGYVPPVTV